MLHFKDIKNLSEFNAAFVKHYNKPEFFSEFVGILKLGKLNSTFSSAKVKGVPGLILIRILLTLPFIDQPSVSSFIKSFWNSLASYGKDTYYRLKNNPKINWRGFLFGVTRQCLTQLDK